MIDEKEIINKCLRNDRKAQKILYDHYAPVLLGVCMRYTRDKAEAEDVLQEGFVKIFSNLKNFEGRCSPGTWIRKIMVNTAITIYHRNMKHRYQTNIDDLAERITETRFDFDTDFTCEELLMVIRQLSPGYRTIFNLYAIEGYRHREIAEMMDIDVNTSKSQYSRAKKLIRSRLLKLKQVAVKQNE